MILQGECLSSLELETDIHKHAKDVTLVVTMNKKIVRIQPNERKREETHKKKQRHESQRNDTELNDTILHKNERAR